MSHTHHAIDYLELAATDLDAARQFYSAAFGWRFNDYGPDYLGFVDGARGDTEAGGIRRADSVTRGGPLPVLYSSDLEATLAAVKAAGAEITADIFEFPGGRRFQFLDPSGNELAVWSPG